MGWDLQFPYKNFLSKPENRPGRRILPLLRRFFHILFLYEFDTSCYNRKVFAAANASFLYVLHNFTCVALASMTGRGTHPQ